MVCATSTMTRGTDMTKNTPEPQTRVISETENYIAWQASEPDGETTYHIEMGNVTVHFFTEEWHEFLNLIKTLRE